MRAATTVAAATSGWRRVPASFPRQSTEAQVDDRVPMSLSLQILCGVQMGSSSWQLPVVVLQSVPGRQLHVSEQLFP